MTFTYDGTLDTDLEKVRLRIGDTASTDPLLTDEEIGVFTAEQSSVRLAAAAAAEAIAAKFARGYNFKTDGQEFNRAERVKHYLDLAKALDPTGARNGAGLIAASSTVKADGYNQDEVASGDIEPSPARGRVRAGYFNPDLPY